jgi:hypothetical protein
LTQKQLFLSARNFISANCNKNINALEDIEFQVFSQFGEDGIIQWILNTINCVQPRILICEYNNVYGPDEMVSVPYDSEFVRTKKHYSNLYWGV